MGLIYLRKGSVWYRYRFKYDTRKKDLSEKQTNEGKKFESLNRAGSVLGNGTVRYRYRTSYSMVANP